jgi:hypothetical protein
LKRGICAFKHVTLVNDDQHSKALTIKNKNLETGNKNLKKKVKDLENDVLKNKVLMNN